jgi:hypothetical protein
VGESLVGTGEKAMRAQTLLDGRTVLVGSVFEVEKGANEPPAKPFVVLMPAYGDDAERTAEAIAGLLIDHGCVEFCCVGPNAEVLHDSIDWVIIGKEAFGLLTTWHKEDVAGAEYFLLTSGPQKLAMLALVDGYPIADVLPRVDLSVVDPADSWIYRR